MHVKFFDQLALAGNPIQISDQQNAQQEFRIDRRAVDFTIGVPQLLTHRCKADVPIDEPQKMAFGISSSSRK